MTLDYKVWIEGMQFTCPAAINMVSIDDRIRSIKGRYLDSDLSLYLEFDDNDEKLLKAYGQQFDKETDLKFGYDSKGRIAKVKGKKGGERIDIKLSHPSENYSTMHNSKLFMYYSMNLSELQIVEALFTKKRLEALKGSRFPYILSNTISSRQHFEFFWKTDRLVERKDLFREETLTMTYEKIFSESPIIYRTNQNKELHPSIEVDTETIINYFLFLN